MSNNQGSLAAAVFAAIVTLAATGAIAADQPQQVAQVMRPPATVTLPEITVRGIPPGWQYDPYTSGGTERASSLNHVPFQYFKVPVGYDASAAMHPYTSGFGPCTEGASPSQGCHHPTGNPMPPSRYEQAPFNQ